MGLFRRLKGLVSGRTATEDPDWPESWKRTHLDDGPTDENLKEIVDTTYRLLTSLRDIMSRLQRIEQDGEQADSRIVQVREAIQGLQRSLVEIRFRLGLLEKDLEKVNRRISEVLSPVRIDPKPQQPPGSRATLEQHLPFFRKAVDNYAQLLALLGDSRKEETEIYEAKIKADADEIYTRLKNLNESHAADPNAYDDLLQRLRLIPLHNNAVGLCVLAEKECENKSEEARRMIDTAIRELTGSLGIIVIEPQSGEPLNESEHFVKDRERNSRRPAGHITKVHAKGYKRIIRGKTSVLMKAKVSVAA